MGFMAFRFRKKSYTNSVLHFRRYYAFVDSTAQSMRKRLEK